MKEQQTIWIGQKWSYQVWIWNKPKKKCNMDKYGVLKLGLKINWQAKNWKYNLTVWKTNKEPGFVIACELNKSQLYRTIVSNLSFLYFITK